MLAPCLIQKLFTVFSYDFYLVDCVGFESQMMQIMFQL